MEYILPVKIQIDCLYSIPTQMIVHFMSMENMMFNMYDYPELFKEMMDRIADDTLAYYRMLEEKHLILPTTSFGSVCNCPPSVAKNITNLAFLCFLC